jgi:hypothetical protein
MAIGQILCFGNFFDIMNKKTLIIGGSILGLLVIGYFVFRKKDDIQTPETGGDDNSTDNSENNQNVLVDNTKPPKVNPIKDNVVAPKEINNKIDYISKNGLGNKAQKTYLSKASPKYIDSWFNAIKTRKSNSNKKGTTFIYNGGVYDSFYGNKKMDNNPIGKMATANKDDYAYRNAEVGGYFSRLGVSKGKSIGVVKGYKFNPKDKNIWLYIPDTIVNLSLTQGIDLGNEFRWIPLNNISLSIPKKQ